MSLKFDDVKNCINKNIYTLYSQWWFNLMKTHRTLLNVEMNAKIDQCID